VNLLDNMAANLLVANPDKTQFMVVNGRKDGGPIKVENLIVRSKEVELLGMKVSQNLGFSSHVEQVKKSLDQRTGFLRRLSHHVPRRELRQVAEGICLSMIRYGLAAYGVP
jgi:hypothetical protein